MAPTRSSGRRTRNKRKTQTAPPRQPVIESDDDDEQPRDVEELFLDPMSGQPLQIYIEKDVDNRDVIAEGVVVRSLETLFSR